MSKIIDAVGKACPMPVVMTKKEMDKGEESIITTVDNKIAVENLKKLAQSLGFMVDVKEEGDLFQVAFSKSCEECNVILEQIQVENKKNASDYVVFLGKNFIGEGSEELGQNLMRMFLYTLTESSELPTHILMMNGGVKLAVEDPQAVEHLNALKEKGIEIMVCGTCLNYFGIADELKIGTVSNMFDIASKMQEAGKVISF
ncbi:MAG: sulfurtransferase-like selenium metabolism protein YedF [Velocimicrobium sp.]